MNRRYGANGCMKRNQRVERPVSAGGVVYRTDGGNPEIVVCGRDSPPIWGLPKGTPDPGESHEQTAVREVEEETGLTVELEGLIDSIDYWFVRSPRRSPLPQDRLLLPDVRDRGRLLAARPRVRCGPVVCSRRSPQESDVRERGKNR